MPKKPKIFLSHAAVDADLAEAFETLLSKATGISSADIFCSSLEGQGVPKGKDFVNFIRSEVKEAEAVVALITPAYLDSAFCMAELGAAWVLGTHRFPVIVPPIGFDAVNATQLGLTSVKIDNKDALSQMLEDLNNAIAVGLPNIGIRRRGLTSFHKTWLKLSAKIAGPQRIAYSVHKMLQEECDALTAQISEADDQISQLEEINTKLRAVKNKEAVAQIDTNYQNDDLECQFTELIDEVRYLQDDLGGPAVLEHAIMDHYGRAGKIDFAAYDTEYDTAVKHGVFDPESNSLTWSNNDLSALAQALDALHSFLQENQTADFLSNDDRRGPEDARFWRNRL